jgi:hypothetical protein
MSFRNRLKSKNLTGFSLPRSSLVSFFECKYSLICLKGMESNPKLQLIPPRTQWGGRHVHDVSEGKGKQRIENLTWLSISPVNP